MDDSHLFMTVVKVVCLQTIMNLKKVSNAIGQYVDGSLSTEQEIDLCLIYILNLYQ